MGVGIDPKVDYAFKRVFGRDLPLNHQLLISLLNAVLRLPPGKQVIAVQVLNPFHERETLVDRLAIVDLKVKDQRGRQYTVEMQMLLHPFFPERLLYYWARLYPQSLSSGDDYEDLRETVVICFLDDVLWHQHLQQYHWHFQVRDERSAVLLTPHLAIHLLELPKFQRAVQELGEPLEQWLYFFRHAEELDTQNMPEKLQVTEIRQALEELQMLSKDQYEREAYEARLRVQRDESIRAKASRIYHEMGIQEGHEMGIKEGHEMGIKEGHEMGIKEGHEMGIKEGHEMGVKEGWVKVIRSFQHLLKRDVTPRDELLAQSLTQLQNFAEVLERALSGPHP